MFFWQISRVASEYELSEEEFVELQMKQWNKFYSICVQYQQVVFPDFSERKTPNT